MVSIVTDFTRVRKKTHSLVKLTPQQRLAFIRYILIIRYNTTSCSSVAITLKGLAGLEQRTKKLSEQVVL